MNKSQKLDVMRLRAKMKVESCKINNVIDNGFIAYIV